MAWRYFIFRDKGHIDTAESFRKNYEFKQGIGILINAGGEKFYTRVKNRILRERPKDLLKLLSEMWKFNKNTKGEAVLKV